MFLRQSTASQEILLGPFLDDQDGNTAETGLTIAASDIKLFKHGATSEASKNSGGATHISAGRYYAVLDATDTNTIGNLEVNVHVSGALPVRRQFTVLHANVYDAMFGTFTVTEPSGEPVYGTSTWIEAIALILLKEIGVDQTARSSTTAGTFTQKNVAGNATIYTRALTDDGTTSARGAAS